MEEKKICLLDLNYTLVSNQRKTRRIRPFSARMQAEEYRVDLIDAVRNDIVIIVTARPQSQQEQTLENILRKTGWQPDDSYFNDIAADPPAFKQSALERFIFDKYGACGTAYYAVESNPKTRAMYARHGITATPYEMFIKEKKPQEKQEPMPEQISLFD